MWHAVTPESESNMCAFLQAFSGYPDTLLNGMKGYEITAGDLDFLRKIQVEKHVKELRVGFQWSDPRASVGKPIHLRALQAELEVVRNTLQRELVLEPMLISSENVQADLDKVSWRRFLTLHWYFLHRPLWISCLIWFSYNLLRTIIKIFIVVYLFKYII